MTSLKQKKRLKIRVISSSPLPIALLGMRPEDPDPLVKVIEFLRSMFFFNQGIKSVFFLRDSSCNHMLRLSLVKLSSVVQKKVTKRESKGSVFVVKWFAGIFSGRIVVETNSMVDPVLYIPYSGRVMHGSLKFSVANTTFFTPGSSLVRKRKKKSLAFCVFSCFELGSHGSSWRK